MATNLLSENVDHDTMARFDLVATQIEQTFNQLIGQLIERKGALLRKVLQLREDFLNKESARKEAIRELEKTQEHLTQLSLRANLNIPIHQRASQAYKQGMEQLTTPTKLPSFSFSCPNLDTLGDLIAAFGDVPEETNYLDKKEPILTAGREGKGVGGFDGPRGIALDEANKVVYIVDSYNSRIQMFSFKAEYINKFGEGVLKEPYGVTVTEDHILITDVSLHSLLRFDKKHIRHIDSAGSKGSKRGKLNNPRGLAVDSDSNIYIADSSNNRVSVFSERLSFLHCFGQGKLKNPQDIKLTSKYVVVLDLNVNCVHFFTRNGDLSHSCITQGLKQLCLVHCPLFFCLDKGGNIIISDLNNHNVKIVSRSECIIHTIGSRGNGRGEFIYPEGIAVSDAGIIYVGSHNTSYVLQVF